MNAIGLMLAVTTVVVVAGIVMSVFLWPPLVMAYGILGVVLLAVYLEYRG